MSKKVLEILWKANSTWEAATEQVKTNKCWEAAGNTTIQWWTIQLSERESLLLETILKLEMSFFKFPCFCQVQAENRNQFVLVVSNPWDSWISRFFLIFLIIFQNSVRSLSRCKTCGWPICCEECSRNSDHSMVI